MKFKGTVGLFEVLPEGSGTHWLDLASACHLADEAWILRKLPTCPDCVLEWFDIYKMKSAADDFTDFTLPFLLNQFFTNCVSVTLWPNWELSDRICLARLRKHVMWKCADIKIAHKTGYILRSFSWCTLLHGVYQLTNAMEHSNTWETVSCLASKHIHCLLQKLKVCYGLHKCWPLKSTLNHIHPFHILTPYFPKIHFSINLHLYLGLLGCLFPSGFPMKTLCSFLFSLCVLNIITIIVLGDGYKVFLKTSHTDSFFD